MEHGVNKIGGYVLEEKGCGDQAKEIIGKNEL